ncbi:aldo/keto reductase [Lentibacillus sp. Marseille-P4043]|uniref:aldo/keto reductase n=1 Tax=Lentibacillus sp. Marseille-P4043 TaxID=2040293 RepID=UPI000D0BCC65|nr:aldo/keto reductase [Lentibacillus sp. Marseille-P4043]
MNPNTTKRLNNGKQIPQLGLGVYKVPAEQVYETVKNALELGYRHIDTASFYGNEEGVGKAIKDSGIPREEIFVTTKVWNDDHGFERAQEAFAKSLNRLGLEYVDLYLIHWPVPTIFPETWKALEKVYKDGAAKAIGVSNFLDHHLQELARTQEVQPAVDQIELHPKLVETRTINYCHEKGIAIESWSPLGRATYLDDPLLVKLGEKYKKSPAQIIIRWHLQRDFVVIPKSTNSERQRENITVFDFHLDERDMKLLDQMDEGMRVGSHPNNVSIQK